MRFDGFPAQLRIPASSHLAMIRDWALQELDIPDDCVLIVKELCCSDCECDTVETLIAVLGEHHPPRQWRIPMAAEALDQAEVREYLKTPGEFRPRDWRCPD